MTKALAALCITIAAGFPSSADSCRLEGEHFQPQADVEIVWNAEVTNVPNGLWIYKVVPQHFPPAVISNLLAIGRLGMKDASKTVNLSIPDRDMIRFQVRDGRGKSLQSLDIAPTLGWIEYNDNSVNWKDVIENVPTESEVKILALDCAFQAGIDRSQIRAKPLNFTVTTTQRGSQPEAISQRGVSLVRRIDGIDERGFCLSANFGSNSRLLSFELNWRNLLPFESHPIATTEEMADFIRNGLTTMPKQSADATETSRAKKLTVTKFTLLYFNKPGIDAVDFEYPYAEVDVIAKLEGTNATSFYLNCPVLSTNALKLFGKSR